MLFTLSFFNQAAAMTPEQIKVLESKLAESQAKINELEAMTNDNKQQTDAMLQRLLTKAEKGELTAAERDMLWEKQHSLLNADDDDSKNSKTITIKNQFEHNSNIICKQDVYLTDANVLQQLQTTFPVKFTLDNMQIKSIEILAANDAHVLCDVSKINGNDAITCDNNTVAIANHQDIAAIYSMLHPCK